MGTGHPGGASILHAPNVHTGGGLVLLQALLSHWPADRPRVALLDERARDLIELPPAVEVNWVRPSPGSRLAAEWTLRRVAHRGDTVLCFHGLPPLLPMPARILVFQQNRHLLGLSRLSGFKPRTALRLAVERLWAWLLRHRPDAYVVQTPSMARALQDWHGGPVRVHVLPFVDDWTPPARSAAPRWDFVYVADGEAHKNHARLLQAWRILAEQGYRPSLALTLSRRDEALAREVEALRQRHGLAIEDLGPLARPAVLGLYGDARALIYPSIAESFGLPLLEALRCGLPILAADLDYVRDVCRPTLVFDPLAPDAIAAAVRRFLEAQPAPRPAEPADGRLCDAGDFWRAIDRLGTERCES